MVDRIFFGAKCLLTISNKDCFEEHKTLDFMNFIKLSVEATSCGICGYIAATVLGGNICTNPKCPQYLCEEKIHIPEKGDTGVSGFYKQTITASGTVASPATTTTIYSYDNLNQTKRGGES